MAHPDVLEAAVIAVPDDRWGERPMALVVPRSGVSLQIDDILEHVRPQLSRYAVPEHVIFIEEIPKTSVGKFDKKKLRDQYRTAPMRPK
ncbi:MAG: hypothetical protein NVSMB32_19160 [Actinomycetota bacterium]